tara:strand:+ start:364 stop:882 length:519 start_codon:yes stop_codon:yes gene_type:complete
MSDENDYDAIIHGNQSIDDREELSSYLKSVFLQIPEQEASTILVKRSVHFILPGANCTAEKLLINSGLVDKEHKIFYPVWLIILSQDILKKPNHEIIYTLSHELAHAFLEHSLGVDSLDIAKEREIEADKKVIEWGFENELKKTPYNYIYGNGIKNIFGEDEKERGDKTIVN